jgi:hypothetical protein
MLIFYRSRAVVWLSRSALKSKRFVFIVDATLQVALRDDRLHGEIRVPLVQRMLWGLATHNSHA